jgi:hypothetical protein
VWIIADERRDRNGDTVMVNAYYKTGFGLAGCYLDDNQGGAQCFTTRRELADAIRYELDMYEFPKSAFAEVGIRRLWSVIANAKSASSFTFYIHHGAHVLTFYGLTEREYLEDRAYGESSDQDDIDALEAYDRGE